jgi:peptidoglycan/LPS O-acetylase OafA/YrhL
MPLTMKVSTPANRRLYDSLHGRDNALNALRLVLATAVIISHSFPVGGLGDDPQVGDLKLGTAAVAGFFGISGYLIARSANTRPFGNFIAARLVRLMPAYWLCLVMTGFGFSAIAGLSRGGWSVSAAMSYVYENALLRVVEPTVGGTLEGAAFESNWNGSLWTLIHEFACYVLIGCLYSVPLVRRHPACIMLVFLASTALAALERTRLIGDITGMAGSFATLSPFFLAGSVLFVYGRRVPVSFMLGATSVVVLVVLLAVDWATALGPIPIAYLLLALGSSLPARVRAIGGVNDVSYGMYVFAFPVQQLLALAGVPRAGWACMAIASTAVTIPLAWASWLWVERPAMEWGAERLSRARHRVGATFRQ